MKRLATELTAGVISALVTLPQAVLLATLAGMPPEHGIYASVFPSIIVSIFGSNPLVLVGPNTTISLMGGSLVASIVALNSESYTQLMLLITLLVGLIQVGVGVGWGSALLRFLPTSALSAVTSAVGVTIVLSQLTTVTGILYLYDDAAWINALRCLFEMDGWDTGAGLTGLVTIACAVVAKGTRSGKFAMPAAILGGTLVAWLWATLSGKPVDVLGRIDVAMLALSLPRWSFEYFPYCGKIALVALSIAFVGLLQTAIIARNLDGSHIGRLDIGREIRAQGLANICAAFTSGMPISGSFNRSAAHVAAGARSRLAGLAASVILLVAALFGTKVICYLPVPVMGGLLMYIGWMLIDKDELLSLLTKFNGDTRLFFFVMVAGIFVGVTEAVIVSTGLSIFSYLRYAATPRIISCPGESPFDWVLVFEGDLFFGSAQSLEDALYGLRLITTGGSNVKLVLHTTYIDRDGHALLARAHRRWADSNAHLQVVFQSYKGAGNAIGG